MKFDEAKALGREIVARAYVRGDAAPASPQQRKRVIRPVDSVRISIDVQGLIWRAEKLRLAMAKDLLRIGEAAIEMAKSIEEISKAIDVSKASKDLSKLPSRDRVIATLSRLFGVPELAIRSRSRQQPIAVIRQAAMVLQKRITGLSYVQIGRQWERDHGTVMHAEKAVRRAIEQDESFARMFSVAAKELE